MVLGIRANAVFSFVSVLLALSGEVPALEQHTKLRIALDGSEPANITDFPYTVAIYRGKGKDVPICTGSILHKNWVLTAAHCVDSPKEPIFYEVVAGFDKLSQLRGEKTYQRRTAEQIIQHPQYWKAKISKSDVALIKVKDFEFNDRVNRVIPYDKDWTKSRPVAGQAYKEQLCTAIGWGSIEFGVSTDHLRYINITVWHGSKACKCFDMFQQRRLICSTPGDLKGVCPGDSGGPLICNGSVAGVAHVLYNYDSCKYTTFGKLELKCNSPKVISAWMYVCPMLDFIGRHVPGTPKTPSTCRSNSILGPPPLVTVLTTISYLIGNS